MKKRPDRRYIEDIIVCMGKIGKYIEKYDFELFTKEELTQDAVIRNLVQKEGLKCESSL